MAWTEQCKVAFRANASAKIGQQKRKNITAVLKELSKQSGIPYTTLRDWYYEKYEKNEDIDNKGCSENTTTQKNDKPDYSKIICIECDEKPVYLRTKSKKPYSIESKYHGLCGGCRAKKQAIIFLDKEANNKNGIQAVCPDCGKTHYINKKRIGG